jgi:hypothetical protein
MYVCNTTWTIYVNVKALHETFISSGVPVRIHLPQLLLLQLRLPPRVLHVHLRQRPQRLHLALRPRRRTQWSDRPVSSNLVNNLFLISPQCRSEMWPQGWSWPPSPWGELCPLGPLAKLSPRAAKTPCLHIRSSKEKSVLTFTPRGRLHPGGQTLPLGVNSCCKNWPEADHTLNPMFLGHFY